MKEHEHTSHLFYMADENGGPMDKVTTPATSLARLDSGTVPHVANKTTNVNPVQSEKRTEKAVDPYASDD